MASDKRFYRQLAGRFGTKYRCPANKLRIGHPATTFALLRKKRGFFLAAAACGGGAHPCAQGWTLYASWLGADQWKTLKEAQAVVMTWFEKIMPSRIKTERRTRSVPEGLWMKCSA